MQTIYGYKADVSELRCSFTISYSNFLIYKKVPFLSLFISTLIPIE